MSTALDEETALHEFLDESVPCDVTIGQPTHEAEIYVKFDCEHCDVVQISAVCRACYADTVRLFRGSGVPCADGCEAWSSLDSFTVVGPVR